MKSRLAALCVLASLASIAVPQAARAESKPLVWKDGEWSRVKPWEYATVGGLALTSVAIALVPIPDKAHWTGGILFDVPARDALRLSDPTARAKAGQISDMGFYGTTEFPIIVDGLIVTALARQSPDVAFQEIAIDTEAYAITAVVTLGAEHFGARARPFTRDCNGPCAEPATTRNVSFYSGHTAFAAASASLTCMHHGFLHLYGNAFADGAACVTGITLAAATGTLRIMSDRHYASDVLIGGAVGTLSGLLVPLFHYAPSRDASARSADAASPPSSALLRGVVLPDVRPGFTGAAYAATF